MFKTAAAEFSVISLSGILSDKTIFVLNKRFSRKMFNATEQYSSSTIMKNLFEPRKVSIAARHFSSVKDSTSSAKKRTDDCIPRFSNSAFIIRLDSSASFGNVTILDSSSFIRRSISESFSFNSFCLSSFRPISLIKSTF